MRKNAKARGQPATIRLTAARFLTGVGLGLAAASMASCFSFSRRSALRRMVLASLAALSALVCSFTISVRFSQASNTPLAVRAEPFLGGFIKSEMGNLL